MQRGDGAEGLSDASIAQWRETGCTWVRGLLPEPIIDALVASAEGHFPEPGSSAAGKIRGFGSSFTFPSTAASLNEATLHEALLGACAALLGIAVPDLRLTQSDLWVKYGREPNGSASAFDNQDQRIHVDFPNHTLVAPPPWNRPEAVELIVFLTDHEGVEGGTAVVPREGPSDPLYRYPITDNPGIGPLPWMNDRAHAEAYLEAAHPEIAEFRRRLYAREFVVPYARGDVLFYRHDCWHRGTPMRPGTRRFVLNATFRRANAPWICTLHKGWSWSAYHPDAHFERLIGESSVDQRTVLGFPALGSHYWCPQTLAAVTARYAHFGFDPAPYADAMSGAHKEV